MIPKLFIIKVIFLHGGRNPRKTQQMDLAIIFQKEKELRLD